MTSVRQVDAPKQTETTTLSELGSPVRGSGAGVTWSPAWWGRQMLTPLALALVLLALYLWASRGELDSIEARQLNADTIQRQVMEHIRLTAAATVAIIGIAVPLGIMLTRPWARRFTGVAIAVANVGQAAPAIGILVLFAVFWKVGFTPALVGIIVYGLLPVLRNTLVGLQGVDQKLIEAARGMGMTSRAVLAKVELPLAVPIILAGIRTALILAVGVATLATFINGGGLGELINTGIKLRRDGVLITGAVLTAVLALFVDWLAGLVEAVLRPKGL